MKPTPTSTCWAGTACTDDLTLPRYSHEHLVQHPTWPTEWILFSVLMAWEDYRYTGDPASLAMFYEDLKAKTLIDPATGLYIDGEGCAHSSLHANMFPLAFGLVPAERREKVAVFMKTRGMACSVYGAQFLMDALFDNGLADHALALMTAEGDRSWIHMVKRVGTTIALEAWDMKYKPNLDWNHAWGAAPANVRPLKRTTYNLRHTQIIRTVALFVTAGKAVLAKKMQNLTSAPPFATISSCTRDYVHPVPATTPTPLRRG